MNKMSNNKYPLHFRKGIYSIQPRIEFPKSVHKNLYETYPVSRYSDSFYFDDKFFEENPTLDIKEINSKGFRCDEFKKDHVGKHILFSGCSYTFGTGMSYDEVWANIVYKKISSTQECSGYFNLGIPGSSLIHEVVDLFKYFKTYGNPDIIFLNIPDLVRFYSYDEENNNIINAFYTEKISPINYLISYQYYLMLDQYCSSNNIKLFSFSWRSAENKLTTEFKDSNINKFETFYSIDIKTMHKFVVEHMYNNKGKPFLQFARDEAHLGISYHLFWANFIYDQAKDIL